MDQYSYNRRSVAIWKHKWTRQGSRVDNACGRCNEVTSVNCRMDMEVVRMTRQGVCVAKKLQSEGVANGCRLRFGFALASGLQSEGVRVGQRAQRRGKG
jgi:hypothetical protein